MNLRDLKEVNNHSDIEQLCTLLKRKPIEKAIDDILSCIEKITITEDIFHPFSLELLMELRKDFHRVAQFLYSSSKYNKKGLSFFGDDPKVVKLRSIDAILDRTIIRLTGQKPADQLLAGYEILDDESEIHVKHRSSVCSIL